MAVKMNMYLDLVKSDVIVKVVYYFIPLSEVVS